ncbi:MAG: glycosyltransferase family 39 protein [Patescibacteria group bacterium]|nr:glycosyltransferase family 39 protein [Patescibacteria group bacterium]
MLTKFYRKGHKILITALFFLLVIFFIFYSLFAFNHVHKFSSPDETLNHFFTKHFIENTNFKYQEPLNQEFNGLVKPRSFSYHHGYIVPGSFLGLPLIYGFFGKIFGSWIIYYLGPLIGSVAVFFFYLFLKEIFIKKIAFIASLLLFIQPVYVFYAMRPFWHNGLFVAFLIITAYFFIKMVKNSSWLNYLFFGIFLGLALITRTSEIFWILLSAVIILGFNYKKLNYKYLILAAIGFLVILTPLLYFQNQTFGQALTTSYTKNITASSGSESGLSAKNFMKILLPFGFNSDLFVKRFFDYSFYLMFLWFGLSFFGLVIVIKKFIKKEVNKNIFSYSLWFLLVSVWLMIYYGSFRFIEFISQGTTLIGISYARYWLPLYVFCLPLAVYFIFKFFRKYRFNKIITTLLLSLIIFSSIYIIFLDDYYGLKVMLFTKSQEGNNKLDYVLENTGENAIIIAGANDKLYFPDRQVIGYNGSRLTASLQNKLPQLYEKAPIYLDGNLASNLDEVNNNLSVYRLSFEKIDPNNEIYQLTKNDQK